MDTVTTMSIDKRDQDIDTLTTEVLALREENEALRARLREAELAAAKWKERAHPSAADIAACGVTVDQVSAWMDAKFHRHHGWWCMHSDGTDEIWPVDLIGSTFGKYALIRKILSEVSCATASSQWTILDEMVAIEPEPAP